MDAANRRSIDQIQETPVEEDDLTVVSPTPVEARSRVVSFDKKCRDSPVPSPATPEPNEGLTDQTNFLPTRQVITVYLGLSTALACSFLEQTIVATALPRISSDLHSGSESSWVPTAYLLTSLAFTPLYGRWSDIFGRKIVLLGALTIFFVFSLACALSQTMMQLIIFRAFQGIGGGAIITVVLIIVSDIVSLKDRGKYQGINEAIAAVSNGVGPILGGIFSQYTTWRWAFWINLPLGGSAIVVAVWLLPLKAVEGDMKSKFLKVDYVGSVLTVISFILMLMGLTWGGVTYPWISAQVLVTLILGILILVAFVVWEAKWAALPIIPMHIFKYKTVVGVYISTFLNGMTFFAILYYIPQFLQLVRGTSPMMSSILLLAFLAPISIIVGTAAQITARTGIYKPMIIAGYSLWTVAQGLQSTITEQSSKGLIIGSLFLAGIASGLTFQTSLIACQAAVPRNLMAVVTGVRMFVRIFGSTITLAISATLVNNSLKNAMGRVQLTSDQAYSILNDPTSINDSNLGLSSTTREAVINGYTRGFRTVFHVTIAYTALAALAAIFLIDKHTLLRDDDEELKQAGKERMRQMKEAKHSSTIVRDVEAQNDPSDEKDGIAIGRTVEQGKQ